MTICPSRPRSGRCRTMWRQKRRCWARFSRTIGLMRPFRNVPEHFALLAHGKIFEASGRLIERGQMADATTLHNFFRNDDSLSDIGGPAYLDEVTAFAVSVINAGEYGNLIYDLYLKRELINLGEDLVNRAYGGEVDETASTKS